jgi:limonene-1,2-epoxide hydrolase
MDAANPTNATEQVNAWLSTFGAALERQDIETAVKLFAPECYWRDLVSFTWNITTLEGRDAVAAMLETTLGQVKPTAFTIEGDATELDGVTEAWLTFETADARGRGHLRLKGDLCWTLLTTMTEIKGHEELKGPNRPKGVEHGAALLRHHRRRTGRLGARRASEAHGCAHPHHREEPTGGRLLAQALQVPLSSRPGLVRPPALYALPGSLAGLLAKRQDR